MGNTREEDVMKIRNLTISTITVSVYIMIVWENERKSQVHIIISPPYSLARRSAPAFGSRTVYHTAGA